jgi:hypothetical protein
MFLDLRREDLTTPVEESLFKLDCVETKSDWIELGFGLAARTYRPELEGGLYQRTTRQAEEFES